MPVAPAVPDAPGPFLPYRGGSPMTAEQLLAGGPTRDRRSAGRTVAVALIRSSFAVVAPRSEEVARHFYATLFSRRPRPATCSR